MDQVEKRMSQLERTTRAQWLTIVILVVAVVASYWPNNGADAHVGDLTVEGTIRIANDSNPQLEARLDSSGLEIKVGGDRYAYGLETSLVSGKRESRISAGNLSVVNGQETASLTATELSLLGVETDPPSTARIGRKGLTLMEGGSLITLDFLGLSMRRESGERSPIANLRFQEGKFAELQLSEGAYNGFSVTTKDGPKIKCAGDCLPKSGR
jgi:hypothetical protein